MSKKIYFYIGNHIKSKSIKWYLKVIKQYFLDYQIIVTKKFHKNSVHIVMEGFHKNELLKIKRNHKDKNIKIIYIITEFIDYKNKKFLTYENTSSKRYNFFYYLIKIYGALKVKDNKLFNIFYYTFFRSIFNLFSNFSIAKNEIRHEKRFLYSEKVLKISSIVLQPIQIDEHFSV